MSKKDKAIIPVETSGKWCEYCPKEKGKCDCGKSVKVKK